MYCAEAIAQNDIIVATGMQGDFMSVVKAAPNDLTKCRGPFFVADFAGAVGEYLPLALPYKVVTGVNTSTTKVGEPAWLNVATAGGVVTGSVPAAVADDGAFALAVKVGRVIKVGTTDGAYLLEPSIADGAPLIGRGTMQGTASTQTFGGTAALELIGCPVVITPHGAHGTYTTAPTAVMESDGAAGGRLALTHPTSTDVYTYMIQA